MKQLACFGSIFNNKKGKRQQNTPLVDATIAETFKEYINNEIPPCFIDTSKLQFVLRRDVFSVFQDEIANVTEEQIRQRMENSQTDPLVTYQPRRETILRQIIQEIVKYVVLSHRWDEVSGEPSYQDISSGKRRISRFRKLAQFCSTARNLGCRLAWVDTCCIERTNAAEHSEAIHATYKWYTNSYLCIAYLAESTSCADWEREPWFTRGWTLQELLAPRRLKFYDKNWQSFTPPDISDDRQSNDMVPYLEEYTGIPKAVLVADNSFGVHGHTFWEIMSWASKQQTTQIEDMAHSLVGFFCVSLPIFYGGQTAFSSLVKAVVAKNPSWDIFVWFGKPSAEHFALPHSPASYPRFDACMAEGRIGVQEITITSRELSLKSLPPIPMEVDSIIEPEDPGLPFLVNLKPRREVEGFLGRYGNLIVECGATRLGIIRRAQQLSACILNHHGAQSRERGVLTVGEDYICFLLYTGDEEDEATWMKLTTNNLLRITCKGIPKEMQSTAAADAFTLSLVTTLIRSPDQL